MRVNTFCLLLFILLLTYSKKATPQNRDDYVSASSFFRTIEKKHAVKVFFEKGWFKEKEFNSSLLDLELESAIDAVTSALNLSFLLIDSYIVVVPSEGVDASQATLDGGTMVVGNVADLGRYSNVEITGRVIDGATGEPLIGAIVYDEQTGIGVASNATGGFSINLPVGDRRIKLSYLGYEDSHQDLRVYSPGEATFEVFERSVHIDAATIMAFRKDANVRSTQMSTVRLDPLMLKELPGAMGERDILKGITLLPGVQSMGEFGTGFNVRGGDSDQNLILIEDMPLFNSSHLFGLVSIVNPDMVTGVTMIKAGIPARYGERASSVLDIRKRGGNPEKTSLSGGLGLLYSRLHFESPLVNRRAFISLGARSSYSNWLLHRIPDEDLMNSSAGFYDLSGVLSFNIRDNNSLSVFGYHSNDNILLNGQYKHAYTSTIASIRLNSTITSSLTSRFTAGFSQYHSSTEQPEDVEPRSAFKLSSSVDYATAKWLFDLKPSNELFFDFGVQAIGYRINPGIIYPLGDDSHIKNLILNKEEGLELASFVSGNYEISPALSAEVGLRGVWYGLMGPEEVHRYAVDMPRLPENILDTVSYDKRSVAWSKFGLEPRVGLRYLLDDNSSVKLSYNRNNQFLNLISNSSVMAPTDVWRLSNSFTDAMVANQFAIGYVKLLPDQNIEFSIESYYKHISNIIEYRDGANVLMNPYIETDLTNAKGFGYGVELYITKKSGALTGWFSYTWSRTMRRTTSEHKISQVNNNSYFPSSFDRPHNLIVNSTYRITKRWRANLTFTYNSGRPVTYPEQVFDFQGHQAILYSERNKYRLPSYHRLDISITLDENLKLDALGKGSWTFSLINVYGRKNAYSVFYNKEEPTEANNYQRYSLYKLYIIGRPLPTVTYNFSF